jgi:dihydroorotase
MNIVIEQGRLLCPVQDIDQCTNVYIADGKVVSITEPPAPFAPDKIIKAKDCLVLPGVVDSYAHLKNSSGEINYQEANAACEHGITTLYCAPVGHTTTDNPNSVLKIVQSSSPIEIKPIGALTQGLLGESISDLTALYEAGCPVFTQGLAPFKDLNIARNCYNYAASFGLKVIIFPIEHSIAKGYIHEGVVSASTGLQGIPDTAETIAIAQHLLLVEETGISAHFSHLTSSKGLELIQQAQQKGLPVSADCSINHLHLTEVDVATLNPNTYIQPPLRSTTDLTALRKALNDGVLSAICSSHQPLAKLSKHAPFTQAEPGISGVDTLLSLGLHLVGQNLISLKTLIKALSLGPMQAYNQSFSGFKAGANADLIVVDNNAFWTVDEHSMKSDGHNSPYLGWELPGRVRTTIKQGEIIYQRK